MASSRAFIQSCTTADLVFCMDWYAVIGQHAGREAIRLARRHAATHMVWAGDDAMSAGIALLRREKRRSAALYSAAQLVAQRYAASTVAVLLQLAADQWWLVAVHEGAVVARTDYIYEDAAQAQEVIQELHQAYSTLLVLDGDGLPFSMDELATEACVAAQLQRVRRGSAVLSWQVRWLALLVLIALLIPGLRAILHNRQTASKQMMHSADELWDKAFHDALQLHWLHGVTGTHQLLDAFYALPIDFMGWQLTQARCHARQSQWLCNADYSRNHAASSNQGFLDAAPKDWTVSFTPLEQAHVSWSWTASGQPVRRHRLKSNKHTEGHLFSQLQAIRPAFSAIVIAAPKSLVVTPPADGQGRPVPQPAGLVQAYTRTVDIRAPLRSVSLLLPHCEYVGWQQITLFVDHRIKPNLKESRLSVSMQGVLYDYQ